MNLLIFEIESPGGWAIHSMELANVIAGLAKKKVRTVAYIPRQALSGAAIISMGCDEIYMQPEAQLGDVAAAMGELRKLVPKPGSYVSESNYFEADWQGAFWGSNYPRLRQVKDKVDPEGLFFVHHGVGSEDWSADGFTRLK